MTTTEKRRQTQSGGEVSTITRYSRPNTRAPWSFTSRSQGVNQEYIGKQVTVSESHSWPPKRGSTGDVGGPFSTLKTEVSVGGVPFVKDIEYNSTTAGGDKTRRAKIDVTVSTPVELDFSNKPVWPTQNRSSDEDLNTAGATAISRCRPTSSAAELSVAVGETYKDGLPSLVGHSSWRDRTLRARNAGEEYLNVQFGWVPLVNDVLNFGNAVTNQRDILSQYDADRGNTIRRQYSFPVEETTTAEVLLSSTRNPVVSAAISGPDIPVSTPGKWYKYTRASKRRWYSGAFIYGIPQTGLPFEGAREFGAKADRLFGISLTPDVLWNLAPWSWAIDWFSNTGDVLSTIGDMVSQGLVMRYGYMMEETINETIYTLKGAKLYGESLELPPSIVRTSSKVRTKANPFGFGITWDGLSSSQAAIAAALGLSRS